MYTKFKAILDAIGQFGDVKSAMVDNDYANIHLTDNDGNDVSISMYMKKEENKNDSV